MSRASSENPVATHGLAAAGFCRSRKLQALLLSSRACQLRFKALALRSSSQLITTCSYFIAIAPSFAGKQLRLSVLARTVTTRA